jgi:isochorismate synthase
MEKAKKDSLPFVVYKKPDSDVVNTIFQTDNTLYFTDDLSESGFVFSPFDDKVQTIIFPISACTFLSASALDFLKSGIPEIENESDTSFVQNKSLKTDSEKHILLVKKGMEQIKGGKMSKVVLSRKEKLQINQFDFKTVFQKLLSKYPATFVYCWFHPNVGFWFGATPETLIRIKDKSFKTMALASTQKYEGTLDVHWGEKEIKEQQFVTDFIIANLAGSHLKIGKPFTLKAGSLLHICSEIEGKLADRNQLYSLVKTLHPTPAVCGLPKEKAKEFILKNEHYNREFYTGFLGEVHMNSSLHENNNLESEETNLFVNLRCMQIKNKNAILYVGGGITENSDPEKEWEETVAKSKIMKSVL